MMTINITDLGTELGRELPFSFTTTAEELDAVFDDYSFTGPITVTGTIVNTGTRWRVQGKIEDVKHFICNRCLKECEEPQVHEFSEDYVRGSSVQEAEEAENADIVNTFEGDILDIQEMIRDTLIAAQPLSNICKPDCKGLCPVCGHDLNEGDCGCDRFVPDPRMAALQQLLKKD